MATIDIDRTTLTSDDPEFLAIAKNDCFQREIDEAGEWLRSPEVIDEFVLALKLLAADLQGQLSDYNDVKAMGQDPGFDDEWRIRTRRLKRAVDRRLQEIVVRQKAVHRDRHAVSNEINDRVVWTQLKDLRQAIRDHRDALLAQEYDPTDHDIALWAALETETQA